MTINTIIETWAELGDNPNRISPSNIGTGIYAIVSHHNVVDDVTPRLMYIGSTTNISRRFAAHEIMRAIKFWKSYQQLRIYFTRCENHIEYEKVLIEALSPKLNTVFNKRYTQKLLKVPTLQSL